VLKYLVGVNEIEVILALRQFVDHPQSHLAGMFAALQRHFKTADIVTVGLHHPAPVTPAHAEVEDAGLRRRLVEELRQGLNLTGVLPIEFSRCVYFLLQATLLVDPVAVQQLHSILIENRVLVEQAAVIAFDYTVAPPLQPGGVDSPLVKMFDKRFKFCFVVGEIA